MARIAKRVFVLVLLVALATSVQAGEFKVYHVVDGDTLRAEGHDIQITVRLIGGQCPY